MYEANKNNYVIHPIYSYLTWVFMLYTTTTNTFKLTNHNSVPFQFT